VYCRIEGYDAYEGEIYESEWVEYVLCELPPFDGTGTVQMSISYDNSHWEGPYDITVHGTFSASS
jgi:hypothetical protein